MTIPFDFLEDLPEPDPRKKKYTRIRDKRERIVYTRSPVKGPGVVFWEGPSQIDGKPICVVCNRFRTESNNRKTGPMVQAYILRQDIDPWTAICEWEDASVCGGCILRAQKKGGVGRACYVQIYPWVTTVWQTYKRGSYQPIAELDEDPFKGRYVRVGAYGDPGAVPIEVWRRMLKDVAGYTAYTSLWRSCEPDLKDIAMASVHGPGDYQLAKKAGWRTFRTRFLSEPLQEKEIICPAAEEGGKKTQCVDCCLCNGRKESDKRRDIAIVAHGTGDRWYQAARCALNVRSQGRFSIVD